MKTIKDIDRIFFFSILRKLNRFRFILIQYFYKIKLKNSIKDRNHFYSSYSQNIENDLSKLCEKHGTDKGYIDFDKKIPNQGQPLPYSLVYHNLFAHCRENIKFIFECGIGSNNEDVLSNMSSTGIPGASLRMWREYFPNAQIYGADIDKRILFEEERIKTFHVDQTNAQSVKFMWSEINKNNLDIIIDDGLHTFEAAITLFENSFENLKPDGIYIIEDVKLEEASKIIKYFDKNIYNTQLISINCPHRKRDFLLMLIRNK